MFAIEISYANCARLNLYQQALIQAYKESPIDNGGHYDASIIKRARAADRLLDRMANHLRQEQREADSWALMSGSFLRY